jgi:SAM-dependent methyltransferase
MSFLNQSRFPGLWQWFQYVIGGSCHKRQLARRHFAAATNVLEIGCSVGNLAKSFVKDRAINYTGVDIDAAVIRHAQHAFRHLPNFRFICGDLCALDLEPFDYVILSAMLHHADDAECRNLLAASARLLSPNGLIVVTDPLTPAANDPWLVRFFDRIEQGQWVRSYDQLLALLTAVPGVRLQEQRRFFLKGSPFGWPRIARCGFFCLRRDAAEVTNRVTAA